MPFYQSKYLTNYQIQHIPLLIDREHQNIRLEVGFFGLNIRISMCCLASNEKTLENSLPQDPLHFKHRSSKASLSFSFTLKTTHANVKHIQLIGQHTTVYTYPRQTTSREYNADVQKPHVVHHQTSSV